MNERSVWRFDQSEGVYIELSVSPSGGRGAIYRINENDPDEVAAAVAWLLDFAHDVESGAAFEDEP